LQCWQACLQTELLRYLRDNVLNKTPEGRELTRLYYKLSPVIVKAMKKDEEFQEEVKELIDGIWGVIGGGRTNFPHLTE